jgi:hypothetical protein
MITINGVQDQPDLIYRQVGIEEYKGKSKTLDGGKYPDSHW